MKILTVGTPVEISPGLQDGWVEVECQKCKRKVHCQEKNTKSEDINDIIEIACFSCAFLIINRDIGSLH